MVTFSIWRKSHPSIPGIREKMSWNSLFAKNRGVKGEKILK